MDLAGQTTSSDPKERPHQSNSRVWDLGLELSSMKRHEHSSSEIQVSRSGSRSASYLPCSCSFCSKRLSQSPNNDVQQNNAKQLYFHNWNLGTLAEAFKQAPKRPIGVGHHCHGSLCGCLDDILVGGGLGWRNAGERMVK